MSRPVTPDESLIAEDEAQRIAPGALTYPFGEQLPTLGEAVPVAPGVRWVRLPLSGELGHINVWLIDDRDAQGDGVAIVDTGMFIGRCVSAWEELIAGPLAGVRITRVIATHFHPDHIGMAGWLCERFRVPLWMTREEWLLGSLLLADAKPIPPDAVIENWRFAGWSHDQREEMKSQGWMGFTQIVSPMPLSFIRMEDGDVIDFADAKWRVVVGRGHAPEHGCLLNEATGVLIAGDQILPTISSNVSVPYFEPLSDPLGDWLASIDRFLELPADLLVLPAHGKPFHGIRARLTALRDEHRKRLDTLFANLDDARRVVDCFPLLFRRAIAGFDLFPATGEALAHLRRLECEGRAARQIDSEGVGWFSAVH
jgi:glyoxylase-like metal-dependent hydrolase (beta-lactamase superfamily II)